LFQARAGKASLIISMKFGERINIWVGKSLTEKRFAGTSVKRLPWEKPTFCLTRQKTNSGYYTG